MDKVRVSLNSPIYGISPIEIGKISPMDGKLKITLSEKELNTIHVGNTLTFSRTIPRTDSVDSISASVKVLEKGNGYIITEALANGKIYLVEEGDEADEAEGIGVPVAVITEGNNQIGLRYNFRSNHNIFLQDLLEYGISITGYDASDDEVVTYSASQIKLIKNSELEIAEKKDTIFKTKYEYCSDNGIVSGYNESYIYMPDEFDRNSLYIETTTEPATEISYFIASVNPFYKPNGELWTDPSSWRHDANGNLYINLEEGGENIVTLNKNTGYWNVPDVISVRANDYGLGVDELERERLADELLESSIPSIINMEREKYSPIIKNNDDIIEVQELEFNLHFRERAQFKDDDGDPSYNEDGNLNFEEGWYIDPDDDTVGWNESGNGFSDLMGYLGFTDDDVYYRKSKVKKSFIRLSFYTSTNPLEQRLLYYSTIFMDSARLYGNYLSHNRGASTDASWNIAAVLTNSSETESNIERIEAKFNVTNEYDRTRSAEGFNCYLFADDADKKDSDGTDRTLYMKVEFNHAGYGKTLPMVLIKDSEINGAKGISISDYLSRMYIPVKIGKYNNKFYYYFETDEFSDKINNDDENRKIIFTLYEPKLAQS